MQHMKQAKRVDNGELVQGYYFYMRYDGSEIPCIAVEPLSANDYSEIHSSCYYEVDPATVEDVAVKPIFDGKLYACPNCGIIELHNSRNKYCPDCRQQLDWSGEHEQQ